MPVNFDLNIIKGSTFSARVIATNADGTPVDLTHYQTRGYVKQRYSDTGVLLNLAPTPTFGYQSSGYIDILISSTGTSVLPITQAVYDIEMYGPDGSENFVLKLLDGRVNIYPEVTNPQSVLIDYIPYTGEASIPGTGTTPAPNAGTTPTTTTTTTTTTAAPGGGGTGGGGAASISIQSPVDGQTVSLPFNLTIVGSNFDHWHWIDNEATGGSNGFASQSVGDTAIGTAVMAGTSTSIDANNLTNGSSWGPAGYIHVVAVDSDHKILANENGAIATDSSYIGLA